MAITTDLYSGSAVSVSTTEFSLTNSSTTIASRTTAAIISLWLDCPNMVAGDEFEVAIQEKPVSGGTQRRIVLANLIGAQAEPFIIHGAQLGDGWDVTLKRLAGADRTFSWSVRAIT